MPKRFSFAVRGLSALYFSILLLVSFSLQNRAHAQASNDEIQNVFEEEDGRVGEPAKVSDLENSQKTETQTDEAELNEELTEDQTSDQASLEGEEPLQEVEVESYTGTLEKVCDCRYFYNTPYKTRRENWGAYFSVGASTYSPENYKPDFVVNQTFDSYFGNSKQPMIEVNFQLARHISSLGSIALELNVGSFQAKGGSSGSLQILPLQAGLSYKLNSLFNEPYISPYATVGAYTAVYTETNGTSAVKGNTEVSLYYTLGSEFQLDWLDEGADASAYEESGIENTYLYVEAKSFLPSTKKVPALDTPLQAAAGLRLEF
jgi:hypothetical protein